MQIFKLFYTEQELPQLDVAFIKGKNPEVFAIQVEPETYREFMNSHYNHLRRCRVQQHIMTNYKFMELIKSRTRFGISVSDISLKNEDDLISSKNEWYLNLRKALSLQDIDSVIESLEALDLEGYQVSKIECFIDTNERLNIHYNGTISFSTPVTTMESYIKQTLLMDYLVKGPGVLH